MIINSYIDAYFSDLSCLMRYQECLLLKKALPKENLSSKTESEANDIDIQNTELDMKISRCNLLLLKKKKDINEVILGYFEELEFISKNQDTQ